MTMTLKSPVAIYIPCLTGGGAEHAMLRLAAGLVKAGETVDFVVSNAIGPDQTEVPANMKTMPDGVTLVDFNAFSPKASVKPLTRYLQSRKPSALISFSHNANVVAILAKKLSGVATRNVLSIQNNFSAEIKNALDRRTKFTLAAARITYGLADVVTGVSKGVADDMDISFKRKRGWTKVIFNPIVSEDMLERSREPVTHPYFSEDGIPVIVTVGRLHPQKDHAVLLQSFAKVRSMRDCRLIIFGQGHLRPELEQMVKDLKLEQSVSLPGYTANPYAYLGKAALFVLSSVHEGLPTVLIEALACGCPVVSTDCPSGPMEILEGGKWGSLVQMKDVDGLAEAIENSLSKPKVTPPKESWLPYTVNASVNAYLKVIQEQ